MTQTSIPSTSVTDRDDRIPLARPFLCDEVKLKVCETLDSGWWTEGPVTRSFEDAFASYIGSSDAIAVSSCTTGLEMALRLFKIGPGDEVIIPDYTYPATGSVVTHVGATAVIVDICRETMLIDYEKLEGAITDRTKAIIPVSLFGNPLDASRISDIAQRHDLHVIEDAACALGAEIDGVKVGTQADVSVYSLHPRKTLSTGEGGMITTNNTEAAAWLRSYKNFGVSYSENTYTFDLLGSNYKMSDILASIGLVTIKHFPKLVDQRRAIASMYFERLVDMPEVTLPLITDGGLHAYQSFPVFVTRRDAIIKKMKEFQIQTQIGTHALHTYPAFQQSPLCRVEGTLEHSRYAFQHCLVLPMYHEMTLTHVDRVIESLRGLL